MLLSGKTLRLKDVVGELWASMRGRFKNLFSGAGYWTLAMLLISNLALVKETIEQRQNIDAWLG